MLSAFGQTFPYGDLREADLSTAKKQLPGPLSNIEKAWKVQKIPRQRPDDVIPCRVVELGEGADAVCAMIAGGHEIPRVSFPACILRKKRLQVGSRFNWLVRDPRFVLLSDVDTNVPQSDELTPEEKAELDRLYQEYTNDLAKNGGAWPEFTGDGE